MANEVETLLEESWALHNASRPSVAKKRDLTKLREARDKRQAAHELDPRHLNAAWLVDDRRTNRSTDTHESLMAFYESALNG